MTAYIALLKAINVGGTGKMPMTDLKALCEDAGFESVKTYIASGNVVFKSDLTAKAVKAELEARVEAYFGKPVPVFVRTLPEMEAILAANPFPDGAPNKVVAVFLDTAPGDVMDGVKNQASEEISAGQREVYIHYPDGQARTKLSVPAAAAGSARNINTVTKLIDLVKAL